MDRPLPADLTTRLGTRADAPALLRLVSECLREYGLTVEPDATDNCLQDVEHSYVNGGGIFEVLVDAQGTIIGSYGLMTHGDGVCELRKMYLHSGYRGRGLGKWLMDRALKEAKRLGFTRVELETASVLKEAVGLYRAYGFKPFERSDIPARCDAALALDL